MAKFHDFEVPLRLTGTNEGILDNQPTNAVGYEKDGTRRLQCMISMAQARELS